MGIADWIADRFWRWRHAWLHRRRRPWERGPRARGLYPAYADWVGAFALDASGDVWFSESPTEWAVPRQVEEPDIRHAAIGVAVRRHPSIAHLTPQRGPEDVVCPTCGGAGYQAQLPPRLRYWIVCECGGLGWVPRAAVAARAARG